MSLRFTMQDRRLVLAAAIALGLAGCQKKPEPADEAPGAAPPVATAAPEALETGLLR